MAKLYVFGIGGTGSRVLRSLTMLLATGVDLGGYELVPIIIDPDQSNGDLTRAIDLLNNYNAIRSQLTFTAGGAQRFFNTSIRQNVPGYSLQLVNVNDKKFRDFIDYNNIPSRECQALVSMLFSDKNLYSQMDEGFLGNPNIGSVVLNQIALSDDFANFANSFQQNDRIFIISSIFGGTGAAGFPLLLKTLRTNTSIPNFNTINQAPIGAVSVLPYFQLQQNLNSEIDSSTFISKTKAALRYYEQDLTGQSGVDSLYFLADQQNKTYQNNQGGQQQQNDAHLIELMAATAIVHFSQAAFSAAGGARNTNFYELGIQADVPAVTFNTLCPELKFMLYDPMVRFTLMAGALTDKRKFYSSSDFGANKGNFDGFYQTNFFTKQLVPFLAEYRSWLGELKGNQRSLDFFNLNPGEKPFNLVTDVKPKRIMSKFSDYSLLTARLNSAIRECESKGREDKFLEMFHRATDRCLSEKLKF